jgi:hypothetical protein
VVSLGFVQKVQFVRVKTRYFSSSRDITIF